VITSKQIRAVSNGNPTATNTRPTQPNYARFTGYKKVGSVRNWPRTITHTASSLAEDNSPILVLGAVGYGTTAGMTNWSWSSATNYFTISGFIRIKYIDL